MSFFNATASSPTHSWLNAAASFCYSIGQISLGLFLHPYQTMQMVIQDKLYAWLLLLPSGFLLATVIVWRGVIVPFVRHFFQCSQSGFFGCDLTPFVANWMIFFVLYWQLLLLYLFVRFREVWR